MKEKYHFIGIGGIGMSALATILLQKGDLVSGSDANASYLTDQLMRQGAEIFIGHKADNVHAPSAVIYNSAIREENPEVRQAVLQGIPFWHRSELLSHLMRGYNPLLVTGTHGKTTTSSLLAHLFVDAGLDPTYAVGGMVTSLQANGGYGKGSHFIAEADESDGSFLQYTPFGAIVTNIDNDHLDYWKTLDQMLTGFTQFIRSVGSTEHLFWHGDDEKLRSLKPPGFSYGFGENNALCIHNFWQDQWRTFFDCSFKGTTYTDVEIPLVGGHNVLNAAAVLGLGIQAGISEERIRQAFLRFKGVGRRTECKGECRGITIFDDYGHHPTEIFATLRAIKQAVGDRRLVAAFQPHRYTRTRDCLHEFAPAFECADKLIITDIYSAGELPIPGVTEEALLTALQRDSYLDMHYVPRNTLASQLATWLEPGDVLVTMGAGDITHVGPEVLRLLSV